MNNQWPLPVSPTPPPAPLSMPTQVLSQAPQVVFAPSSVRVALARIVTFGGAVLLAIYGYLQMTLVFGNEVRSPLEWALLVLFTVTFGWIALSATQAIASLFSVPHRRRARRTTRSQSRTALVMPVYNEDPAETCAALYAMGAGFDHTLDHVDVEIFILSDTREPSVWLKETAAFQWLRERLKQSRVPVWYRRRHVNKHRKSGNLQDFVERWGSRYDYMLVLDADSLMEPATIVEMIRRMDEAPRLAILQTVPMLCGGETLFARLQQFASRVYGPTVAHGVDAWQGMDGNYWGHNALIRVRAFAENCGLPELSGRKPLGGPILSHDFVEAALIRRAGWEVRMDADLDGSWEGAPPSLLDLAVRDRRWAQGNLQHIKVVGAAGLRLPNRIHLLIGITSYVAALIWLAMLCVGAALTAQTLFVEPQYFPRGLHLFPEWPVFDSERMAHLFVLSISVLLAPKLIGLLKAVLVTRYRRQLGGVHRVVPGVAAEIVLSALYAPVLMCLQVAHLWQILRGKDSGWRAQQRTGHMPSWAVAIHHHRFHALGGIVPLVVVVALAPDQLIWVSPVILGLILAPALSRMSGSVGVAKALAGAGLLTTPEELQTPEVAKRKHLAMGDVTASCTVELEDLVGDASLQARHCASLNGHDACDFTEQDHIEKITAKAKIHAATCGTKALKWMSIREKVALLSHEELLSDLMAQHGGEHARDWR